MRYVALLRGINVGGKNLIKMTALKQCFEGRGFEDVSTYIQSGNVLFVPPKRVSRKELVRDVEAMLSDTFGVPLSVVLRSRTEMTAVVATAPKGFGREPAKYRYDVVFLKEPLTAAATMKQISMKEGVDQAWTGKGVIYLSRLTSRATSSRLNRIASLPIYKSMTIRNWNTTTKLLSLLER